MTVKQDIAEIDELYENISEPYKSAWTRVRKILTEQLVKTGDPMRNMSVQALAGEIVRAVVEDEADEGCDLSAGMFGSAMSSLIRRVVDEYLAPRPVGVRDGWKLVPVRITSAIYDAMRDQCTEDMEDIWNAAIAAAPAPGKGEDNA